MVATGPEPLLACGCYDPAVYRVTDPQVSAALQPQLPLWDEPASTPPVQVRHSQRARRIAVRIRSGGQVELVVPRGVAERQAWAFLESRAEWVRIHVAKRRAALPPPQEFPPRVVRLPLLGETWRVFRAGGDGRARLVQINHPTDGTGDASCNGVLELRGTGTGTDWHRLLIRWLTRRALESLGVRLEEQALRHGFTYSAVRLRRQRTRWGSCSTRGVISLNLALLFQPADVVRYLLCHELAHTRHMNHSARFWRCVAACEPRWRQLDAELLRGWRHVPHWLMAAQ